jgi:glycosyltransferase involved in cell wall biosynthesis
MCYGVPVVAYSMGAFPRFIEDGVTGALVGAGDLGALVNRIHELYREPGRLASIGAAGRRSVREQLGPEGLVRGMLTAWAAAAAAHRGEPGPPAECPASK